MPAPRKLASPTRLRAASSATPRTTSSSDAAGGRSRPDAWTAAGMSAKSASTESMPSAPSMTSRSAAVCGPYAMGTLAIDERAVRVRVEEAVRDLTLGPDPDHPPLPVGIRVDELGGCFERLVHRDDLA